MICTDRYRTDLSLTKPPTDSLLPPATFPISRAYRIHHDGHLCRSLHIVKLSVLIELSVILKIHTVDSALQPSVHFMV